jgi:hypothetical protein
MDALEVYAETQLGLVHVFQSFIIFQCSGQEGAISFQNKTRIKQLVKEWSQNGASPFGFTAET